MIVTHIKTKIIIQDFMPKLRPYNNPSIKGSENKLSLCKLFICIQNRGTALKKE
jgi:hypothetical protein